MYGGREWHAAFRSDIEEFVAETEWVAKHVPKWNPTNYNGYVIRETGVTAAQEVAFLFAQVFEVLKVAQERDADMDLMVSKISFTFSAMIDIFEEVAKFRAARKIYAKTLKEKYGVKNPKSLRMKMHVNTGGILMEHPQAIINVARGAYAGLAAVLGGCQSLQICGYDEAIAIPTEEAATIALRTEQILAFESGATNAADPLGGSYYVEALTEKMEDEIQKILNEIENMGGLTTAIKKVGLTSRWKRPG
jgi:methylmalonyl-CoA mutase N-terminal domain/subunit